jgi:hypothetical protein
MTAACLTFKERTSLDGPYYVFVVTDPARAYGGSGLNGKVFELDKDNKPPRIGSCDK